ncbi:MAG TPA: Hsp70 family protein [Actinospica sp.]|jgi:hypothetical protein|nr:Hsp70 family protein [Actinospica sp.]
MARIVAAIDFGTHGTGFAWAFSSARDDEPTRRNIYMFDNWTSQPTTYVKNLSALLLDGSGGVVAWGYEAQKLFQTESREHPEYEYAERFKMRLLPPEDAAGSGAAAGPGRSPQTLITAYLRSFYRFTLEQIIARSGVAEDEITWCLTVPAIWKDRERQIMRDCAVAAGLPADTDRLLIAVEPEVAALYCRFDGGYSEVGDVGDRFMVVDAGGGTVDITAYEKTADGLTEIGYTDGGSLGSTYIDRQLLETVIPRRLGAEFVDTVKRKEPAAFAAMMDDWERAKREFEPGQKRPIILQLSHRLFRLLTDENRRRLGELQNGVDDEIVISPDEITDAFDHVVRPLLKLVDAQNRKVGQRSLNRVLLVGGFAQSPYLQQRLREHLEPKVELMIPAYPSQAVLAGAVHYGLNPATISGRRSRFTYGVGVAQPFDEMRDRPEDKVIRYDGTPLCNNRFDVFVGAGDVVEPGHKVVRDYYPINAGQREMTLRLFTAETTDPRYLNDATCREVGNLTLDMSSTAAMPPAGRRVEMTMHFGGTEVEATARDVKTGIELRTSIRFS